MKNGDMGNSVPVNFLQIPSVKSLFVLLGDKWTPKKNRGRVAGEVRSNGMVATG